MPKHQNKITNYLWATELSIRKKRKKYKGSQNKAHKKRSQTTKRSSNLKNNFVTRTHEILEGKHHSKTSSSLERFYSIIPLISNTSRDITNSGSPQKPFFLKRLKVPPMRSIKFQNIKKPYISSDKAAPWTVWNTGDSYYTNFIKMTRQNLK